MPPLSFCLTENCGWFIIKYRMLPRLDYSYRIGIFIVFTVVVLSIILGQSVRSTRASDGTPPEILEPSSTQTISGFQNIKVYDPAAETLDIYLSIGFSHSESEPCYTVTKGLTFDTNNIVNYSWDSTTVVDSNDYVLWIITRYDNGPNGGDAMLLEQVENGKTGNLCSPPFEPPLNPPPPVSGETSDPSPSEPDTSSQPSSNMTQPSEANQPKDTSTESGEAVKPLKQERKDALIIFDEEVPIELDRFDPDIFLKGENLEITKVSNSNVEGTQVVQFAGKTSPSTLVTLYIFSSPVAKVSP